MNTLVQELSDFAGIEIDKSVIDLQGVDNWCGESYKQAQKEIKISQKYFDKYFSEPYVYHF